MRYQWCPYHISAPYVWEKQQNKVSLTHERRGLKGFLFRLEWTWDEWLNILEELAGFNVCRQNPNSYTYYVLRIEEAPRDKWVIKIKAHVDLHGIDIEMPLAEWVDLQGFMSLEPKPLQGTKATLLFEPDE